MMIFKIIKEFFLIFITLLYLITLLHIPIAQSIELDLVAAQEAVGKRFASKFCEAKEKGFSSETSSEFALNNTYLKFVAFPNEEKFIEDLWEFTISRIRQGCGQYVAKNEENNLRDFFVEEDNIARKRDLYLPH